MIGRSLRMVLAVLVLGIGFMAPPAQAVKGCSPLKNLTKGCRNEIKACIAADCASLTGRANRLCKHACKSSVHTACKADPTVCTGSPSGAFVQ